MKLKKALNYINLEKIGTQKQDVKAITVMFKKMYKVNVKNKDGSYKSMYDVLNEANKKFYA